MDFFQTAMFASNNYRNIVLYLPKIVRSFLDVCQRFRFSLREEVIRGHIILCTMDMYIEHYVNKDQLSRSMAYFWFLKGHPK